jgi:hypothetical protein
MEGDDIAFLSAARIVTATMARSLSNIALILQVVFVFHKFKAEDSPVELATPVEAVVIARDCWS